MFIFVMFKDAPELSATPRRNSSDIDLAVEKTLLVNPKCPVRIMLEYIRKKCRLGSFTTFDLCDESGYLKGLFSLPTYAYATDLFCHKKIYYVIVVKQVGHTIHLFIGQMNICLRKLFMSNRRESVNKTYPLSPRKTWLDIISNHVASWSPGLSVLLLLYESKSWLTDM